MNKFKNIKFIRYGNIKTVKQKHYTEKNKTYHNPPVKRGFYAMPHIKQEPYIVNGLNNTQPHLFKNEKNQIIEADGIQSKIDKCLDKYKSRVKELCESYDIISKSFIIALYKNYNIYGYGKSIFRYNTLEKEFIEMFFKDDIESKEQFKSSYFKLYNNIENKVAKLNNKYKKKLASIRKEFYLNKDDIIWHHLGDRLKNHQIRGRSGSWVLSSIQDYEKALYKDIAILNHGGGRFSKDHYEVFITKNI